MPQVLRKCNVCGNEYSVDAEDKENLCHTCYLKKHDGSGWYIWLQTGSGSIEILAPVELVRAVVKSGDNEEAVNNLMFNDFVEGQLYKYSAQLIIKEYKEAGLNIDDTPKSFLDCEKALLWSLCWDCLDSGELDKTENYISAERALALAFGLDLVQTLLEKDVDCYYDYEVLKYEKVNGVDIVYMAKYVDDRVIKEETRETDIYELTIPDILEGIHEKRIKLFWKHNI